ncbi:MAG: hypothetical protein ACYDG2_09250 [Ruminiclostridium sp.]
MEIITGYFVSRQQAIEATEYLRNKGFKGKISVMGRNSEEEDIDKTENMMRNTEDVSGGPNYGAAMGFGGVPIGLTAFMLQGSGQFFAGAPITGIFGGGLYNEVNGILNSWGIPKKEGEEIRRVIDSGNSVILLESEKNEKQFICDILQYKGAQNIHS